MWTVGVTVEIKLRLRDGIVLTEGLTVEIKLCFRDGLVWTVGLTVQINLRFRDELVWTVGLTDEVDLNADNVMQVLYLAKKYMLPSLAGKCSEFLRENLDVSNVFHVLPDVQKYEEKDLENHCWEVIDKQTDEAVKSDGFVTIEKSMLEELVERDSLNVREVELFKAVDCWATRECKKQLAAEGSVKRETFGERIVKAICFPVIDQEEFADVVLDSDILTKKDSLTNPKSLATNNGIHRLRKGALSASRLLCQLMLPLISFFVLSFPLFSCSLHLFPILLLSFLYDSL